MADDPLVRGELGLNLTYGLLEVLGRAIVTGAYRDKPFPIEAASAGPSRGRR